MLNNFDKGKLYIVAFLSFLKIYDLTSTYDRDVILFFASSSKQDTTLSSSFFLH
jgi:hypothetical protein